MAKEELKIGVILSYVSMALNMVIQLFYTPVMISLLGQSEYGLYNLVGSVISYLSLFSFGFNGAYLRFSTRTEKNGDRKELARLNGMFLLLFLSMSAAAFVCGMLLSQYTAQLLGSNLTSYELGTAKKLMQILAFNMALTFPSTLFDSMVSAHEQFLFQRLLTLAGVLCNPLVCLPLLLMGHGSVMLVTVTTCITVGKLIANLWFCLKKLNVPFRFDRFDGSLLKEIAGFSVFLFINMIIDQANWSVDKFILGRVAGTGAVAVYSLGAQINSLILQFSTAVSSVFSPRVNRIAASDSKGMRAEFTELMIRVGRIQCLILMLIISGFAVFGHFFITELYATQEYAQTYAVALLLIVPEIIPLIQNLGIEIQRAMNMHQFRSIVYLLMAIVNVAISIPLARHFGPAGAALGTAIGILVANGLIMNLFYYKAMGLDMIAYWRSILQLLRGMLIPLVIGYCINRFVVLHGIWDFALWVAVYAVVYGACCWLFSMNKYEKNLVCTLVKKLLRRSA